MVLGRGEVWADATYEYKYSPELNTNNYFTVSSTSNFTGFPSNTVQVDGSYITGATKMGGTVVTFETTAASSTVYVGIYIRGNNINTFKFDDVDKSLGTSGSAAQGDYGLVQIDNVGSGQHRIEKKSGNEVELYYVKVVEHNYSYPDATVQTYPHTWDFTKSSADWGTTSTQVVNYDDWDGSGTYFHTGTAGTTRGFNIDVLKGLRCQSSYLGVDWGYGHIYVTAGSITIPSVPAGYGIIFTMEGRQGLPNNAVATTMTTSQATPASATINPTESSHTTYTFDVASAGDVTFNFNGAISIKSIAVTPNTFTGVYTPHTTTDLQIGTPNNNIYILDGDDKERTLKGTYTFTGPGRIAGGTVIDEVPGIIMTVGAEGDTWEVVEGNGDVNPDFKKTENNETWNIGYVAVCKTAPNARPGATSGCFYTFKALVNGELTIDYYTRSGAYVYNGNTPVTSNNNNRIQDITFKVEAGKTYTLEASTGTDQNPLEGIIWLNSFTFTPMFFHPGTTTNQRDYDPAVFPANMNTDKSAFPKLINPSSTEQQNKVKFAGDKEKVYLYKNNDVDLLAAGTNILIRGTVLDKNNEDGLVAYYYLNSYVLTVSSYELEDQAYIETSGLTDGNYHIVFSGNVQPADASNIDNGNGTVTVQVQKDADTPWNVTAHTYANQAKLFIPIDPLVAGATYRITIPANSIALTANTDTKNSKIERTFSVNANGEAQVKMIYPTGLATVGTTIVLETYINGNASVVSDAHKVKGILSDGNKDNDMEIDATFSSSNVVFKPKSTLKPNTTYTLTIPTTVNNIDNKIYLATKYSENPDVYYQVTHDKVFTFMTGSSSGSAPTVVRYSPTQDSEVNAGLYYSTGRIEFEFNQAVELEPFSIVNAVPVNGGNKTAGAETKALEYDSEDGQWKPNSANTLKILSDDKTVYFDYSEDEIKYDLYYEVTIPANTVVGAGGLPNGSPIVLKFKMGKNPSASEVEVGITADDPFYPHTWDFNKLGADNNDKSTCYLIKQNTNSTITDRNNANPRFAVPNGLVHYKESTNGNAPYYADYRTSNSAGCGFIQGADIKIATSASTYSEKLPEFKGLRVSLDAQRNSRFALRNLTESDRINGEENARKNADGTDLWEFRMNGNTHYLTISNVPRGKLYMVVNSKHLGINSPNATFESVSGATITNNNTLMNTNGVKKVVINVAPTKGDYEDVSFCVKDFSCEKIGVSTYSKPFKSQFAVNGKTYATDCQPKAIRHDLVNAFTGDNVRAYYVSSTDGSVATATELTETSTTTATSTAGAGTIVVLQSGVSSDTEIPFFKTDVNTAANENMNLLRGTTVDITNFDNSAGNKFFFSNLYKQLNNDKTGFADGTDVNETDADFIQASQMGFYRAMGTVVSANKAWLEIPSSSRKYYVFKFDDEEEPTIIKMAGVKNVTDDGNWYTLQGLRVANPAQGTLYIHNGKKVVFK